MDPVFLASLLDAFFTAAFAVIVPLLLAQRGLGVESIGIVFALAPIVFQVLRIAFAYFADLRGVRKLFLLNSVLYPISGVVFFLANSVPGFLLGKILEGGRTAAISSVNRSAAFDSFKRHSNISISLFSIASIATAIGGLAAGVALAFLPLSAALLLFSALSFAMFLPSLRVVERRSEKKTASKSWRSLDPRFKPPVFRQVMAVLAVNGVSDALVYAFILPLFLNARGIDFWGIGLHMALFAFVSGAVSLYLVSKRKSLKMHSVLFAQVFLAVGSLAVFPFLPTKVLFAGIAFLAVGDAYSRYVFESLVVKAVATSRSLALDVGLLHTPFHFARAAAIVSAGFIVAAYGFWAVFLLSAAFYAAYALALRRFYY